MMHACASRWAPQLVAQSRISNVVAYPLLDMLLHDTDRQTELAMGSTAAPNSGPGTPIESHPWHQWQSTSEYLVGTNFSSPMSSGFKPIDALRKNEERRSRCSMDPYYLIAPRLFFPARPRFALSLQTIRHHQLASPISTRLAFTRIIHLRTRSEAEFLVLLASACKWNLSYVSFLFLPRSQGLKPGTPIPKLACSRRLRFKLCSSLGRPLQPFFLASWSLAGILFLLPF
ncbi:hypothetical protein GGI42DRAFT_233861 [Trichoderma sp. SZMC 28013]